jgi:hypothetical protein
MRHSRIIRAVLIAATCSLPSCSTESTQPTFSPSAARSLDIQDLATTASIADRQGVRRDGAAPASSGGPTLTVSGNQAVLTGGTLAVSVRAAAPFAVIYIFVGGKTLGLSGEGPGGVGGYYELRLPSAVTSENVLLTFPQTIPLSEFELLFAVADPSGVVGPYTGLSTSVIVVGTGDVQVTLSWDTDSDVDLHVVDPSGEEVFYAHRQSASGGALDLDSNAGCDIDHVRNENITWPVGRAPRGRYTVRVDYWDSCAVAQTNFTVRINNVGGNPQLVTGSFTGLGDQGGLGSGRTVATFDRQTGPTATTYEGPPISGSVTGASKQRKTSPSGVKH